MTLGAWMFFVLRSPSLISVMLFRSSGGGAWHHDRLQFRVPTLRKRRDASYTTNAKSAPFCARRTTNSRINNFASLALHNVSLRRKISCCLLQLLLTFNQIKDHILTSIMLMRHDFRLIFSSSKSINKRTFGLITDKGQRSSPFSWNVLHKSLNFSSCL